MVSPEEKIRREDRDHLWAQPQFRRFLFEFYSAAGITRATREEQHALFLEGKRSLGLEILGWFEPEPDDAIASILEARITFSKGAKRDRSDESEPDPE